MRKSVSDTAKMASAPKHFKHQTKEQLEEKQEQLQNQSTIANEKKAVKAFKAYLDEAGVENTDFFTYSQDELNEHLAQFYFAARTEEGEMYKMSSLEGLCYGLNRALKRYGHNFDITKRECTSFTTSIKAFEDAKLELKQCGKGFTKNTKHITLARKFLPPTIHLVSNHANASFTREK